jgi:hypothetical protein
MKNVIVKSKWMRLLGRSACIKRREIGCESVNWVEITHNRCQRKAFMNMMMNLFLKTAGNF